MLEDGKVLEARDNGTSYNYQIYQTCEDDMTFYASIYNTFENLCSGTLYECLDACNEHHFKALLDLVPAS